HLQCGGREVQDAADAGRDEGVGDALGRGGRRGDDGQRDLAVLDDVDQGGDRAHLVSPDDRADEVRVGVDDGGDLDAPGAEALVGGQCRAQVTGADDDDGPRLGLADDGGDVTG